RRHASSATSAWPASKATTSTPASAIRLAKDLAPTSPLRASTTMADSRCPTALMSLRSPDARARRNTGASGSPKRVAIIAELSITIFTCAVEGSRRVIAEYLLLASRIEVGSGGAGGGDLLEQDEASLG